MLLKLDKGRKLSFQYINKLDRELEFSYIKHFLFPHLKRFFTLNHHTRVFPKKIFRLFYLKKTLALNPFSLYLRA